MLKEKYGKNEIRAARLVTALLLALITMFSASGLSYAVEPFSPLPVEITGRHVVDNNDALRTGRHTFVLTSVDGAPMPQGSAGGVKKTTINSNEEFGFGSISYDKPGIYAYTVSRETTQSRSLKEDDSVYGCTVTVWSDGTSVIVFTKKGTDGKPNRIEYRDKYTGGNKGTKGKKVKTGDSMTLYAYGGLFAAALIFLFLAGRKKKDRRE